MNVKRKNYVLLLVSGSLSLAMIFVYIDWLDKQPPEKILLDSDVLLIYSGIQGRVVPTSNQNMFDYFSQNYYSVNSADLELLPPVLYKYHTLIVLDDPQEEEIKTHANVVHLYGNYCTKTWKFEEVQNGIKLDCNPENIILQDNELQKYILGYIENSSVNWTPINQKQSDYNFTEEMLK